MTAEKAIWCLKATIVRNEDGSGYVPYEEDYKYREIVDTLETALADARTMHNELCLMCGNYKDAHLGACNDCRWRKELD